MKGQNQFYYKTLPFTFLNYNKKKTLKGDKIEEVGIDLVQNAMFLSANPTEVASKAPVIRLKMYMCSTLISQLQDGSLLSLCVCSSEIGVCGKWVGGERA